MFRISICLIMMALMQLSAQGQELRLMLQVATGKLQAQKYDEALEDYQAIISAHPDNADAYLGAGSCQRKLGDFKSAKKNLRKAKKLAKERPDIRLHQGILMSDLGRKKCARKKFRKSVELDSNFADGYYAIGLVEKELGNYGIAVESFDRFNKLRPFLIRGVYEKGKACILHKDVSCAEFSLDLVKDNLEGESYAWYLSALVAIDRGDIHQAMDEIVVASQIDSLNLDYRYLGFLLAVEIERFISAEAELEQFRENGGPNDLYQIGKVRLAIKKEDTLTAREAANQLYATDDKNAWANWGMGRIAELSGDFEEAYKFYKKASKLRDEFTEAQYRLGLMMAKLDKGNPCKLMKTAADVHYTTASYFAREWVENKCE